MTRFSRFAVCLAFALPAPMLHAACEDVIALSKVTKRTISDKSEYEKESKEFCNEYQKNKSKAAGMSLGVQYAGVGVSLGSNEAKAEAIASRMCEAVNNESSRADAYKQYVEDMAEGTYPAYEKCIASSAAGIQYAVSATEHKMTIQVVNGSKNVAPTPQKFMFSEVGRDLSCAWQGKTFRRKSPNELPGDGTAFIECERTDTTKPITVIVAPETRAELAVEFKWPAYRGGEKVDDLLALQTRVRTSEAVLGAMRGGVVAFNLESCPAGWKPYEPAYGVFIRGLDLGQKKVDPDGKRALGALQEDKVGPHEHTTNRLVPLPGGQFDSDVTKWGFAPGSTRTKFHALTAEKSHPTIGAETRPKNVALLYCAKE